MREEKGEGVGNAREGTLRWDKSRQRKVRDERVERIYR